MVRNGLGISVIPFAVVAKDIPRTITEMTRVFDQTKDQFGEGCPEPESAPPVPGRRKAVVVLTAAVVVASALLGRGQKGRTTDEKTWNRGRQEPATTRSSWRSRAGPRLHPFRPRPPTLPSSRPLRRAAGRARGRHPHHRARGGVARGPPPRARTSRRSWSRITTSASSGPTGEDGEGDRGVRGGLEAPHRTLRRTRRFSKRCLGVLEISAAASSRTASTTRTPRAACSRSKAPGQHQRPRVGSGRRAISWLPGREPERPRSAVAAEPRRDDPRPLSPGRAQGAALPPPTSSSRKPDAAVPRRLGRDRHRPHGHRGGDDRGRLDGDGLPDVVFSSVDRCAPLRLLPEPRRRDLRRPLGRGGDQGPARRHQPGPDRLRQRRPARHLRDARRLGESPCATRSCTTTATGRSPT